MERRIFFLPVISFILVLSCLNAANAQRRTYTKQQKDSIFKKLQEEAYVSRKFMMPMRDGIKLSTNIYRPKTDKKVPIIFVRTPYNFNRWVNGKSRVRTALSALEAVKHGYAYIVQNERGRYFSQGKWDILGTPLTDASDAFKWMRGQAWSNGKIGLRGCSSTAEWQLGAASIDNAADAMVPMGYGAGVGRVGQYYEQGNWYRGGVFVPLFAIWLYSVEQDIFRPRVPENATQQDLIRISRFYDEGPDNPSVNWPKAVWHLPIDGLLTNLHGKKGIYEKMIRRTPDDPAWYKGGLYNDSESFNVPSFWFVSWYDVGVSPNLAMFNYVRKHGSSEYVRNNQYLVIAPTTHCGYFRSSKHTMVGDRDVGDARYPYTNKIYQWFDYRLKGEKNGFTRNTPHVQYYTMGTNEWNKAEQWPPKGVNATTFYLNSDGHANSMYGDGTLSKQKAGKKDQADHFTYDPMVPVITHGGSWCCAGGAGGEPGALDQREQDTRGDILIYETKPLTHDVNITGTIKVTLYVSSDAKDTDFTFRLIDVYPDGGPAYNITSTIQRARYREGYDKEVFMKPGKVYKLTMTPMNTSNVFKKGHRIRIAISSSNFPRFARNLNTGGNNYDESKGVVAHNVIHHSDKYPSQVILPILPADKVKHVNK